ncbi:hypothetical protein HBH56_053330 [Parastagonospora nodorum]|nr:hypothetical protein HBH56_053330 [Parastagonospora nodorum]KAH3935712.1 hypothetical protein HBH54_039130 [Parastagonospora nodorum]KAH3969859.1 hypothetical protein HBH51_119100 [Parastagonospora nodorum]KAH3988562.1 hypothetical protein HBH52_027790 [Parastagonospora nodorum]KAH4037312.1 hypothetical protein HBI09_068810 [Parastagonospora nodorum]
MHSPFTYDHRALNTRLPVRSAIFKQRTGGLVVRWVTTGESPLLYVFAILFALLASLPLPVHRLNKLQMRLQSLSISIRVLNHMYCHFWARRSFSHTCYNAEVEPRIFFLVVGIAAPK